MTKSNRFEDLVKTKRGAVLVYTFVAVIAFCFFEIISFCSIFMYYKISGKNSDIFLASTHIGRPFFDEPISVKTDARYLGHIPNASIYADYYPADPVLGWRLGKSVGTTKSFLSGNRMAFRFTSPQGFAPAGYYKFNVNQQKNPGTFRVVMFGGSTMEGEGAAEPLDNLPSQMKFYLEKNNIVPSGYKDVEIINAGVGGYSSAHEYLYFVTELAEYQPDMVIFYDGWNDMDQLNELLRVNPDHRFSLRQAFHEKNQNRLNESYTITGAGKQLAENLRQRVGDTIDGFASYYLIRRLAEKVFKPSSFKYTTDPFFDARSVDMFMQNVRASIAFAEQRNIRIAYFLQPLLGVGTYVPVGDSAEWLSLNPEWVKMRRQFYDVAQQRFADLRQQTQGKSNICVADISRAFDDVKEEIYEDSGHVMRRGNEIVSVIMTKQLNLCGFLPSPAH